MILSQNIYKTNSKSYKIHNDDKFVRKLKTIYLLFLISASLTPVILNISPVQIRGQPLLEYECALPNSPSSSVANEDPSCNKKIITNTTTDNCFDAVYDGPKICIQPQTPFVPSGLN